MGVRRTSKSRTGCVTCKSRKKKCDETKPICKRCKRLGLSCAYISLLYWHAQNQQKVDIPPTTFKKIHFINYAGIDVSDNTKTCDEKEFEDFERISNDTLSIIYNDPNYGPQISEPFLFKLYTDVLSRTKSFADSEFIDNGFIQIVIPRCNRFPALYSSVLALSSLNLIKTEATKEIKLQDSFLLRIYNTLFMNYKNDAINFLHDILDDFHIDAVEMLEELVVTIILLCNIEITNKGNRNWIRYLSEASLVFSALTIEKIVNNDIFKFAYKYFSLRYILLITTLNNKSLASFVEFSPWPIIPSLFKDTQIESMYGCSPQLLYMIYEITMLNYKYETKKIGVPQFISKISKYWYTLNYLIQLGGSNCEELIVSSKSYLFATKIFIFTILQRNKLTDYLDDDYKVILPQLWLQLNQLSRKKKSLFFPNWCLLIITTTITFEKKESERVKAFQIFDILEINWPLSSVVEIKKAIVTVWKIHDLCEDPTNFDYRDVFKDYKFMLALT